MQVTFTWHHSFVCLIWLAFILCPLVLIFRSSSLLYDAVLARSVLFVCTCSYDFAYSFLQIIHLLLLVVRIKDKQDWYNIRSTTWGSCNKITSLRLWEGSTRKIRVLTLRNHRKHLKLNWLYQPHRHNENIKSLCENVWGKTCLKWTPRGLKLVPCREVF